MFFLWINAYARLWSRLTVIACLSTQSLFAQIPCAKPDAGSDQQSTESAFKLRDAPPGYFWCIPSGNPAPDATIHAQTGQVTGMRTAGDYRFVLSSVANSINLHADKAIPEDGALRSNTISGLELLDNGQIKVGVDSRYGGAITYLSTKTGTNMVNNYDLGRQIQIAGYSGPLPFHPPGVEVKDVWGQIGWNPIQAGDYYHNSSRIVAFEKRDNLLYVKTVPKFWPLRNYEEDCTIEHWIRLAGNVVKVHARITLSRTDQTSYSAREQEFPCLYLNSAFKRVWSYNGKQPFTNADKYLKVAPFEIANVKATEPWIALTRDNDVGVGLYSPGNLFFKEAFFGDEFSDNEFGASTAYIAATPFAQLDHHSTTDFDYEMILGHVNDIRSYVYMQPRPDAGPNYRFTNSRAGWHLFEGRDTGYPVMNHVQLLLNGQGSQQFKSPAVHWKGSDNPKIYVRAAFNLNNGADKYQFHWRTFDDADFLGIRYKEFSVINDNQFRTYEIDLTGTNWTSSDIRQILLSPSLAGSTATGTVRIEWVSNKPDGPPAPAVITPSGVCTDTVMVTVKPSLPDAGPDIAMRCGIPSVDLPKPKAGLFWRIDSAPVGSSAAVSQQGTMRNMNKPGTYAVSLVNESFNTSDQMNIVVPDCGPPQTLTSSVFFDNGQRGAIARNGTRETDERGIPNVFVTLYTDPNGDGDPKDGQLIERVRTDANGVYQFNSIYANELYVIALDVKNFVPGGPLWRTVSTRQSNYSLAHGLLSTKIQIRTPSTPVRLRALDAGSDGSFGVVVDCPPPTCLALQRRRL